MKKYAEFNEKMEIPEDVALYKGLIFPSTNVLWMALRRYSVQKHFDYMYLKNDKIRVQAHCMEDKCDFYIFTSKMRDYEEIQVKSFIPEHTYGEHTYGAHNENLNSNVEFLAQQYFLNFRDLLSWSVIAMRGQICQNFNINVLLHLTKLKG